MNTPPALLLRAGAISVAPALFVAWAQGTGVRESLGLLAIGAMASWLSGSVAESNRMGRIAIALVAGAAVLILGRPLIGSSLAIGLVLSDWVLRQRPPVSRLPDASSALVAMWSTVGGLVGRATFAVLAMPLLVGPWVYHRLVRSRVRQPAPSWQRSISGGSARSTWTSEPPRAAGSRWLLRAGVVGVVVAVGVLGRVAVNWSFDDGAPPIPSAFADSPWYPEYFTDMNWVMHGDTYEPLATVRVKEAVTPLVNVNNGRRETWHAPPCSSCPRLSVWVYGGSTTFGLGQRDLHTIPSEIARAGWADGVVLDVQNRGNGGDTHWEEAQRFAWDVTVDEPPDLVVFYDGTNEFMATRFDPNPDDAPSVIPAEFWDEYLDRVDLEDNVLPEGATRPIAHPPAAPTSEAAGAEVAKRYERSRSLSRLTAERLDVEIAYFWQPTSDLRSEVAGEPAVPGRSWAQARSQAARSSLSSDVIDISGVFDGVEEPLYYDTIHTNEDGALLAGRAMYGELQDKIDSLTGRRSSE